VLVVVVILVLENPVPKGPKVSARGFNPGNNVSSLAALTRNMVELSRAF
jgi:hypothetical protein